jgi:hypothetical protein
VTRGRSDGVGRIGRRLGHLVDPDPVTEVGQGTGLGAVETGRPAGGAVLAAELDRRGVTEATPLHLLI